MDLVMVSGWGKCFGDKDWWGNTTHQNYQPPFPSDIAVGYLVRRTGLIQKTEILKSHKQGCIKSQL